MPLVITAQEIAPETNISEANEGTDTALHLNAERGTLYHAASYEHTDATCDCRIRTLVFAIFGQQTRHVCIPGMLHFLSQDYNGTMQVRNDDLMIPAGKETTRGSRHVTRMIFHRQGNAVAYMRRRLRLAESMVRHQKVRAGQGSIARMHTCV